MAREIYGYPPSLNSNTLVCTCCGAYPRRNGQAELTWVTGNMHKDDHPRTPALTGLNVEQLHWSRSAHYAAPNHRLLPLQSHNNSNKGKTTLSLTGAVWQTDDIHGAVCTECRLAHRLH